VESDGTTEGTIAIDRVSPHRIVELDPYCLRGRGPIYFGALLPAAVGAAAGCPAGDPVAFATEAFAGLQLTCLSASSATFASLARAARIPVMWPPDTRPAFLRTGWPAGAYVFFLAIIVPGGLADGRPDPGELLAVATRTVLFAP
jgi:hypothetical protein